MNMLSIHGFFVKYLLKTNNNVLFMLKKDKNSIID
jgi:hypothetical protein